jgi:hypothetical protein
VTELIRTAFTAGHPRIRHSQAKDALFSASMAPRGTAKIGDRAEGAFTAERTAS